MLLQTYLSQLESHLSSSLCVNGAGWAYFHLTPIFVISQCELALTIYPLKFRVKSGYGESNSVRAGVLLAISSLTGNLWLLLSTCKQLLSTFVDVALTFG